MRGKGAVDNVDKRERKSLMVARRVSLRRRKPVVVWRTSHGRRKEEVGKMGEKRLRETQGLVEELVLGPIWHNFLNNFMSCCELFGKLNA